MKTTWYITKQHYKIEKHYFHSTRLHAITRATIFFLTHWRDWPRN